jgi:hypothetical protein
MNDESEHADLWTAIAAIAALCIDKNLFTTEEYEAAVAEVEAQKLAMIKRYEEILSKGGAEAAALLKELADG